MINTNQSFALSGYFKKWTAACCFQLQKKRDKILWSQIFELKVNTFSQRFDFQTVGAIAQLDFLCAIFH